ncbi:GMC family oxidoreductase [Sporobolomyces salmoneus]|uniref:GMC family oxidoreductase n=1 Tax=Sporobolomyces salmoneus TaxID=183962 RepID=UPI003172681F
MKSAVAFSLLLALVPSSTEAIKLPHFGRIDANDNDLVQRVLKQEYTHIVVGGGNAGLAVASRLSEEPTFSVLVLEAGTWQPLTPGVVVPGLAGTTFNTDIDWAFYTQPQEHAKGRRVYWPRGKILGGSSALNFMAWTRGHKSDYDSWDALGAKGWNWNSLLPYFKKSEKFSTPSSNNQNAQPVYDASVHGTSGPVQISFSPYISDQFTGFYEGIQKMGVSVANDLNDGKMDGVAWSQSTIGKGGLLNERRVTSQTAYIDPIWLTRSNLCVLPGMQATRVLFDTTNKDNVKATGVEFTFANITTGHTFSASATREVILSAGSIQTPQLLELSGIGDASFLESKGINSVVDLPGVGENLADHPAIVVVEKLKEGSKTLDAIGANPILAGAALAEWALGKGILTQELSTLAYLDSQTLLNASDHSRALTMMNRLKSSSNIPTAQVEQQIAQVKAGSPIMEFLAINVYFGANAAGEPNVPYLSLAACAQKSFSRGSIHIASNDPKAYPNIDPQYLQADIDKFYLMRAAQFLRELAKTDALSQYIDSEAEPGPEVQSEQQLEDWIENVVRTEYHPIGTAKMGARNDQGVVDENLIVHGTSNLRVVDLSVMPMHVSTHPQSTAYAIAEKAADLMRQKA